MQYRPPSTSGRRLPAAELLTTGACLAATAAGVLAAAPLATSLSLGAVAAGATALLVARRSKERLLRDAGITLVTIDTRGCILEWAGAGAETFGYSRDEILGHNVAILAHEPVASEHDGYLARFVAERRATSRVLGKQRQVSGRHRDGHAIPMTLFVRPVRRRGALAFEGILQPIPDAGGQRESPQREDFSPQLSWRWLRNLGHEIRTPMAGIQGHAEILVDPHTTVDERRGSAEAILRNSRHLVELLSDLLDHARLTAGQFPIQLQTVALREFLADVVGMVRGNASQSCIRMELQVDAAVGDQIVTDPLRLRQILLNLLGNALKFTREGWVRLEVTPGVTGSDRIFLDVADTGAGIGSDFAPLLFQPFQQEHRAGADAAGSGLGLSICRRLARMMGGDLLLVDSVPDVGSRFRIDLPRNTETIAPVAGASRMSTEEQHERPLTGLHILVVDDARDLLYVTRRTL